MKPNFLVVGAGKCGTSSLCFYLDQHSDVFVCEPKEPNFFTEEKNFQKGLKWYESMFRQGDSAIARGEGSVNYSKLHEFPLAAKRVATCLPDARIIYIVRSPLERLVSEWRYRRLNGAEDLSFERAILEKADYIQTTRYRLQIDEYRKYYDDKRILVIFLEDMRESLGVVLNKCLEFLGVGPSLKNLDENAQNVATEVVGATSIIRIIHCLPGFEGVKRLLPRWIKRETRRLLGRKLVDLEGLEKGELWTPELLDFVKSELEEESKEFLLEWGKEKDFWNFNS